MDNQHRKITGYRDLNQGEIDLVNEIKAAGAALEPLIDKVKDNGGDERCAAKAKTELQDGFMWLIRAVTKPESFV